VTRSSAETQLDSFLAKYTPEIRSAGRAAVGKLRTRFPGAVVLVYDNYNALAIGFGPTERPSDVVFSIALFPRWVNLFFLQGADLPDPAGRLEGTGKRVRQIVLEGPETLDQPDVRALLALAAARARPPFDEAKPGRLVIQSISVKQRPRRPQRDGGRASRRGSEGARSRRRGDASPARRKG
jgi:hypothetical protein